MFHCPGGDSIGVKTFGAFFNSCISCGRRMTFTKPRVVAVNAVYQRFLILLHFMASVTMVLPLSCVATQLALFNKYGSKVACVT